MARLELRDLRSLERRSMYSIFHPLDPNERLPRELVLEGQRYGHISKRSYLGFAAFAYLPALGLSVLGLASFGVNPLIAFGVAGLLFAGFSVYAITSKQT